MCSSTDLSRRRLAQPNIETRIAQHPFNIVKCIAIRVAHETQAFLRRLRTAYILVHGYRLALHMTTLFVGAAVMSVTIFRASFRGFGAGAPLYGLLSCVSLCVVDCTTRSGMGRLDRGFRIIFSLEGERRVWDD